jgi:Domain of unknown function (DUF1937)
MPKTDHPLSAQRSRIIYLACPYTDASPEIREQRFRAATKAAAALIKQGHIVFSPITMTHPIDVVLAGALGTLGSEFWIKFDEAFMPFCSELVIVGVEGWDRSSGIAREREFFEASKLPVWFVDPETGADITAAIATSKY